MKSIKMKGKNVNEATEAAAAVLGVSKDALEVRVISEGKAGMMGLIGGEEAEVEATVREGLKAEAEQVLQTILDKMGFLAMAEGVEEGEGVKLNVKGEDMGRIIGKEGNMLRSLEIVVSTILMKIMGKRYRVSIDAGEYKLKREKALERLAKDVADEVESTKQEKSMPPMSPGDRRVIHTYLSERAGIKTFSKGEGKERRLVIAPAD
ncbi:hypothetical protein A2311_06875 [candidate division WOR-1 bacterium RIFOXYB2_FULL_48_7]|uniref:RNA-binding protein KhpB n=1 Tax=candidate division WOR-1 bacterium RIFOXYB2_FULL_48_7 TaxID=1802583 RepID=A0A1F4TVU1_UNCSA|nr:MAG: hypothetical protein A2311_06875 [candidate division WOR-1 bacterium RIFOXYB2_FULL_48_7]